LSQDVPRTVLLYKSLTERSDFSAGSDASRTGGDMNVAKILQLTLAVAIVALFVLTGCEDGSGVTPTGEATLLGYSNTSDCVRDKGEEIDGECYGDPPRIKLLTDGLEIEIIHQNACFNCCLDTILVDLRQEEHRIILTESEDVTNPCRCLCPFRVTASVEVSLPGDYRIEIYALENLIWTGEVTVSGN
jgi:hypothetical protein